MRLSIASKIVAVTIAGIVISSVAVMTMTVILLRQTADAQLDTSVRRLKNVAEEYYHLSEQKFNDNTRHAAANEKLVEALDAGDAQSVVRLSRELMVQNNADLCTITDARGTVVARGHSDRAGDSLAAQAQVSRSLKGESTAGIVASTVIPFSIRACFPITRDGRILGTISLGVSIVNEAFVDGMKRLSGLDVTFFKGDTRVMSTITQNGKRIVGTRLDNPAIEEAVLKRGQEVFRDAAILGEPYKTAYWPVKDIDNKTVGIWFVGQSTREYLDENRKSMLLSLGGMLVIAAILAVFSIIFGRRLAGPIKAVTEYSSAVSGGALDARLEVKATDEVGILAGSLQTMVEHLKLRIAESEQKSREASEHSEKAMAAMRDADTARENAEGSRTAILQAAESVDQVVNALSAATEELSAQVEQSSRGAESQRSAVASAATAMDQMNTSVREVAHNATVAAEGSESAREKAAQGADVVVRSAAALSGVQGSTDTMTREVEELGKQAESIGAIMSVINDIADQTNLLALNAAIEAARAGEAGRGFAVVADEVRKLAEKTMQATKEVGDAIKGIQQGTQRSIDAMGDASRNVDNARNLATESGDSLARIVAESQRVAGQIQTIAAAAEQQSSASEEIAGTLERINIMAAENAVAMTESSRAVIELARQTNELQQLVSKLRTG